MAIKTKLLLPNTSSYKPSLAMELANLIERAYQQYQFNQGIARDLTGLGIRSVQLEKRWEPEKSKKLIGSKLHVPELPSNTTDISGKTEYEILSVFRFTGYWLARLETVPFGFIAKRTLENGKTGIFVIFRGTLEKQEWYRNFDFGQDWFLGVKELGLVSKGFHKIYVRAVKKSNLYYARAAEGGGIDYVKEDNIVWNSVVDKGHPISLAETVYQTLSDPNKCPQDAQVFVAGHSLGGALATLATLHIATQTNFKPTLYSFASPRVGDPEFAKYFDNIESYRIANSEDIVTTVPPAAGSLIGEEMREEMGKAYEKVESLRQFIGFATANLAVQLYQHVGQPLYFTDNRGAVSYNHNMFETYREALLE